MEMREEEQAHVISAMPMSRRGRMQGAVLIGETGLEEAFENLILVRPCPIGSQSLSGRPGHARQTGGGSLRVKSQRRCAQDQLDISQYGPQILAPELEIDHHFD